MVDFPNKYNIPDEEYYMRRYINDLPDPLTNLSLEVNENLNNWNDNFQHSMTLFTSCHDLSPITEYSDNWNRPDSVDLGSNWQQFYRNGTISYQIVANRLNSFVESNPINKVGGAWFNDFPLNTDHQISQITYKGSRQVSNPSAPIDTILGGGPCVRMVQSGIGTDWEFNVKCYNLYYQETRSATPPYSIINNNFGLIFLDGTGNFTDLGVVILLNPLVDGDIIKLTAMNFFLLGTLPFVCLKGYVNNIQQISVQLNLAGATGITTGRAGIGTTGSGSDGSFVMDWDDWKGYTAAPI